MNHNPHPIFKLKKILWRIIIFLLLTAALLTTAILLGRTRRNAMADEERNYETNPYQILEIVPYEGLAQWGYMVEGQEPISSDEINQYYKDNQELKDFFWSNTSVNNNKGFEWKEHFSYYFEGMSLEVAKDASGKYLYQYKNNNVFADKVLCSEGGDADWWKGKITVVAKAARNVTVDDVNAADLIVIHSSNTANVYNNNQGTGTDRYPRILQAYLKFKNLENRVQFSAPTGDEDLSKIGYEDYVSLDGGTPESLDISWTVAMAIADRAFDYDGTSTDGTVSYPRGGSTIVSMEKPPDGDNYDNVTETNMRRLQIMLCDLSARSYREDGIRQKIVNGEYNDVKVWKSGMFCPNYWNMSEAERKEAGYYLVATMGSYLPMQKYDYIIRMSSVSTWNFYITPEVVQKNEVTADNVYEILSGIPRVSEKDPEPDKKKDPVRILEIQPSNWFWMKNNPDAHTQIRNALGITDSDQVLDVTYVTPNRLNGMTTDLCADYDLIVIGADCTGLGWNTKSRNGEPYYHNGFYADAVMPSTLINGLLDSDYTTMRDFATRLMYYAAEYTNPEDADRKILRNIALEYEKSQAVNMVRSSGNDITDYMQKQLAAYVNLGKPVILRDGLYDRVENGIKDFNTYDRSEEDGADRQRNVQNSNYENYMDSNMYFALAGVADETALISGTGFQEISAISGRLNNVYNGVQTVSWNRQKIGITVTDTGNHSVIEMNTGSEDKLDLTQLTPVENLSFQYEISFPSGENASSYDIYVVVDRNGDGIFDINGTQEASDSLSTAATIRNDIVYSLTNQPSGTETALAGTFGPKKLDTLEEVYAFQVIVKKRNSSETGTWTGYVRPATKKQKSIRILQITPDEETEHGDNSSEWQHYFDLAAANGEYRLESGALKKMSESDFSVTYASGSSSQDEKLNRLVQDYNLIIIGTDFSADSSRGTSDLSSGAASLLRDYINEQHPMIITNDVISYTNSSAGISMQGELYYQEGTGTATYRYTKISATDADKGRNKDANQWNYELTRYLRDAVGMDRFGVTQTSANTAETHNRDTISTRRWAKTAAGSNQGYSNGLMIEYMYSPGYNNPWFVSSYGSAITFPSRPRTDLIRAVNEGRVGSYPYSIGETMNDRIKIKENHAPFYQLYLNRDLDGDNDDVTVWYTLESPEWTNAWDTDQDGKEYAYFKATTGDAVNNYYLYSKGKTFYTGFSMYGTKRPTENECKLFVNTIYAALNSEPASETTSSTYSAVVETNALIRQYGELSSTAAVPNRYLCYYMEGELEQALQTIRYEITNQSASGQTISVEISRKNQAATSSNAQVSQTVSDVVIGNWYDLSMSNTGPYTNNMDGLTLVIRPVPASSGPDQICINAEITFVKKELFDLD